MMDKVVLALRSVRLPAPSLPSSRAHWRTLALAMLMIAVGLVHLLALSLMLYTWPLADDYDRYAAIVDNSLFDCLRGEWLTSSGRWFGTGLSFAVGTIVGGESGYRTLILINWLIFIGAVTVFFATVLAGD